MFHKKYLNRLMALLVFFISFVVYWRTIAQTVSFWDCGEFIACSFTLGIPHPPGAPFYLLLGRLFSMIPWTADIALRVNIISALTSSLTVMLTYLIIVRLIQLWRGVAETLEDRVMVYASGIIGALAFAFSDTLWFNAVEAEVYAISLFFTAIVVWLILIWYEKADDPGSDRYLLLIMYCVGLSTGIHLLNVLALPAVTLIVYFRKHNISFSKLLAGLALAALTFGLSLVIMNVILTIFHPAYKTALLPFLQLIFPTLDKIEMPGMGTAAVVLFPIYLFIHIWLYRENTASRFYSSSALLLAIGSLLVVGVYPGVVKGVPWLMDKGAFSVINPLLLVTISITALFYLFPKFELTGSLTRKSAGGVFAGIALISVLQYFMAGDRVWDSNIIFGAIFLLIFIGLAFMFSKGIRYRAVNLALLALMLVLIGSSTYLMIYIRSGLNPEIDENDPETTKAMVSYLNRDQYGQWSITDRTRWKQESRFSYSGEMDYLWNYQIKRMYLRYFAWQFMGKGSQLDVDGYIKDTFSFRGLFWLPFLLGFLGMIYHFYKDWRQALSILVLFVMTGLAIVIYLNQEDPQPRERDYVYVASYFAFALWIGIGVIAILEKIGEWFAGVNRRKVIYQGVTIIIILVLVPLRMLAWNYDSHDRTGNYIAYDYSYNILQSCEKDGILFTNGDNDTFPLWYLQNCAKDPETGEMGLRKDVRVVNLSLLNTPWYIKQLKNHEPKVPISLTDAEIDKIMPIPWKARLVSLDVPKEKYFQEIPDVEMRHSLMQEDTVKKREVVFEVAPTLGSRDRGGIRVQDQMILNILFTNKWQKPVYFAVTVSRQNQLHSTKRREYNFDRYLRMDGLAFIVSPRPDEGINPEVIESKLLNEFNYRGLNDSTVYYNENILGLLTNYRAGFMRLALHYRQKKDLKKMGEILDKMEEKVPEDIISIDRYDLLVNIGQLYLEAGRKEKYLAMLNKATSLATTPQARIQLSYEFIRQGKFAQARYLVEQVANVPNLPEQWSQQAQTMLSYINQMEEKAFVDSVRKAQPKPQPADSGVLVPADSVIMK